MDSALVAPSALHRGTVSFFTLLWKIWQAITPPHKPGLLLLMLPVEILQHIHDLLPLSAAVSLSLSSRKMLSLLGSKSLHSLRAEDQITEKKRFLLALEKDLPGWQLCHPCSLFHPLDPNSQPGSMWCYSREPQCVQASGMIHFDITFRLRYQHAQVLMNRYRFGLPHEHHLRMLSKDYEIRLDDTVLESSIKASIISGGLVMQVVSKLRLLSNWNVRLIERRMPKVCPHDIGILQYQALTEIILCQLNHGDGPLCAQCANWKPCQKCSTWFLVDIRVLETEAVVRVDVRRWLGFCETPFDLDWRRHCDRLPGTRMTEKLIT